MVPLPAAGTTRLAADRATGRPLLCAAPGRAVRRPQHPAPERRVHRLGCSVPEDRALSRASGNRAAATPPARRASCGGYRLDGEPARGAGCRAGWCTGS